MQRPVRTFAAIAAASLATFALVGLFAVQTRAMAATLGVLPLPNASAAAATLSTSEYEPGGADGSGVVNAVYCSEDVAARSPGNPSGRTSTSLALDDSWFAHDARRYNHQLATSCAVLSAVCNSESRFYSSDGTEAPYAELALGALGFERIRTESYALRSTVLDQLAALVNGTHYVAAYTFASKQLPATDARQEEGAGRPATSALAAPVSTAAAAKARNADASGDTLVFVGIRGSYGAEWISNFDFRGGTQANGDHPGFKAAEQEVAAALDRYLAEIGADPARTRVLITGHSRGGAIGNLLAADLIGGAGSSLSSVPAENVYAYTFAAPCATQAAERSSATYAGIYNVVNPSDLVPQLPLSAWGYGRYGITVELPSASSDSFDESLSVMQQAYRANTGLASVCDETKLAALDSFDVEAERTLPTPESFLNPLGVAAAVQTLLEVDLQLAALSHYPDTYIAWMQAVDGSALTFARAG